MSIAYVRSERSQRLKFRRENSQLLLKALLDAGLTQTDIADSIGVTQAAVSRWLAGVNTPGMPIITALRLLVRGSIPVREPEVRPEI
jgi:transcriptional regulator with XRE-family HTH domain